jgi:hypothetical protein
MLFSHNKITLTGLSATAEQDGLPGIGEASLPRVQSKPTLTPDCEIQRLGIFCVPVGFAC